MLKGKNIIVGITGGIAAYKTASLVRLFVKAGASVQVIMTPNAREFITPVTLSTLSGKPVVSEFFTANTGQWNSHVDLGLWADAMVIAPATASTIAKMAHGVADNMLLTTYLSMKAPVMVAPAMDLDMYAHPATQANLQTLRSYGNIIIEPTTGFLASHLEGKGRMEEPENIVKCIEDFFRRQETLSGKTILVTAGPTYEKIDPVRFIGNYSSGKMGMAIVDECLRRGAKVKLVLGPVSIPVSKHPNLEVVNVESAAQMYDAAVSSYPSADAAILSAAVADFTPTSTADHKIKRKGDELSIVLKPTMDIAAELGKMKTSDQVLVGFALETNDENANAQAKLKKKNFDFIVLNSLNDKGAGFRVDTNKITIIKANDSKEYPLKSKTEVASDIIDELEQELSRE